VSRHSNYMTLVLLAPVGPGPGYQGRQRKRRMADENRLCSLAELNVNNNLLRTRPTEVCSCTGFSQLGRRFRT
jgi:hypothetical protein